MAQCTTHNVYRFALLDQYPSWRNPYPPDSRLRRARAMHAKATANTSTPPPALAPMTTQSLCEWEPLLCGAGGGAQFAAVTDGDVNHELTLPPCTVVKYERLRATAVPGPVMVTGWHAPSGANPCRCTSTVVVLASHWAHPDPHSVRAHRTCVAL